MSVNIFNPLVYIPSFLKIRTKSAELVNFKPNKPQLKLVRTIEKRRAENRPVRVIILKARQMGFSTMAEALAFHDVVTHKLHNALIIAHEDSASQNLYTMFKTFYDNLPAELAPMTKRSNSGEMLFENPTTDDVEKRRNSGLMSSVKVATARNTSTGRSQTLHFLHCSEVGFWNDAKTLVTGLFQCVPNLSNTTIILESTANGVGGFFYETWQNAVNGENDFIPLFFAWFEEPSYSIPFDTEAQKTYLTLTLDNEEKDLLEHYKVSLEQLNWRRWCIKNNCTNDIDKFHQEYPAYPDEAFIASGRPRFNTAVLKQYRVASKTPIKIGYLNDKFEFEEQDKGYIKIYKEPVPGEFYSIGADVAEGLEKGDYSTATVLDSNCDIVAKWRGHIDPDLFGEELVKLSIYYNEAYLGIESNNHGLTTIKAVQRKEYYNLFFTKIYDKLNDSVSQKVGWSTNSKTKPLCINKLAEFIRDKLIGIPDLETINECLTYVIDDKGGTNAQEGCFDDTVMSTAIALQVFLEGKSDTFKPTVIEDKKKSTRRLIDGLRIPIDESEDEEYNGIEVSI